MKKRLLATISSIIAIAVAGLIAFIVISESKFRVEEEYYDDGIIEKISAQDLETLVNNKESFLLFVSQQDCRTADDFRKVIQSYIASTPLHVFETSFSDLKSTNIASEVRFYPSFLVFKNGKLVRYLRADSDDDVPAYTTKDGLESWLKQVIIID